MSGEFELLASLAGVLDGDGPGVPVGVGDDAAVVEVAGTEVVVAVDTMVDGVHVDLSLSSYADLGWKALAVNLSDLAAMGATPIAAVVALQRPAGTRDEDVHQLYAGMREAADRFGCKLVGGDTVGGPVLAVSVTVVGAVEEGRVLRRDGARVGDVVVAVGSLGRAAAALALHRADAHEHLGEGLRLAHARPVPRPDAGRILARLGATSAIDVSDGLGRDLGHIADASQVAIRVHHAPVPPDVALAAAHLRRDPEELVLGGGDDYALAATVPADRMDALTLALDEIGEVLHLIGEVVAGTAGVTRDGVDIRELGWQHD